jgi:HJR/Mrr/RecB family endonuclease
MNKKNNTITDDILDLLEILTPIYALFLFGLWFFNRQGFWELLFVGLGFIIVIFLILFLIKKSNRNRKEKLIAEINRLGIDKDIDNFINRWGKEKEKYTWKYMGYGFDYNAVRIFIKTLSEKGLNIRKPNDIYYVLRRFIDNKQEALIRGGFGAKQHNFSSLSGNDFEKLLVRLCESMGYIIEHPGGVGDQGADLIITKNGQRILIQAKCYNSGKGIGNDSVQQAVAAKTHYDCNRAMVIGVPYFTLEAKQLAKTNQVDLIDRRELQSLLLEHLKENWI